jgi:hypothetical protein
MFSNYFSHNALLLLALWGLGSGGCLPLFPKHNQKNNMNPFAQQSEMDQMCGNFQLTRMQRFYGFGGCFAAGFLISFLSTFLLFSGSIGPFAALYTMGNILSLIGTGFLTGFVTQFKVWGSGHNNNNTCVENVRFY